MIVIRMMFIDIYYKIVIQMTLEWQWLKDMETSELKNIKEVSRQNSLLTSDSNIGRDERPREL